MKLLLTTPYDLDIAGGVNHQLWLLYRQMRHMGLEVRVLAPSSQPARWRRHDVITVGGVIPVRLNGATAHVCLDMRIRQKVQHVLESFRPDIIHLQEPLYPLLNHMVLRASQAANVGTFHTYSNRHWPYRVTRPLLRGLFQKLDQKIAVSTLARDYIAVHFPGPYAIIPNSIDLTDAPRRGSPRRDDHKKQLLFVGRLNDSRKGFRYLLRAYERLERRAPGTYCLCVVGPGQSRWRGHRIAGDVRWMDQLSDAELKAAYAACDLLCAPSVAHESFGIIVLEAFACGKPVVAFNIAGYADLIANGRNGVLVPKRDDAALAEAITDTLAHPTRYARMCREAAQTATQYDASVQAQTLWSYYQEVLAKRQHARSRRLLQPSR
jgi:phosphatidylinositol alpha-mannosyltransferase